MKYPTPYQTQNGYTLVELAISVAILSVLVVAGLLGVQSILLSGQVNDQVRKVARIGARVSTTFLANPAGTSGWAIVWRDPTSSFGTKEEIIFNKVDIGAIPAGTGFVYKIAAVPQSACADLAKGSDGFSYAMHIKPGNSTYPVNWITEKSVVKAPGAAAVNIIALATLCDAKSDAFDFYIALAR
jgi:prepilin-type N-terminal cleavage/methylation domain-containing protein